MDSFADYILNEEELSSKMEIVYYLSKKRRIFFNKSVVLKTEITRMFLNYSKIDVDKNEELARRYGVMSIPTIIFFKDGKEVKKHIGFIPEEGIKEIINNL